MSPQLPCPLRRATTLTTALMVGLALTAACSTSEKKGQGTASHAVDCADASLRLPDDTVVATVDGKPVTVKDLGEDVRNAEQKALWTYCDTVQAMREQALDGYVTEKLVEKAAAANNQSVDEWMQAEMKKRMVEPTEAEIQAFYDARKRPGAPPLEEVRAQVAMVLQREKSESAIGTIIEDLKKDVSVETKLPDVRSPPKDIGVAAHTPKKGGDDAKVQVVEFADFECPYCSKAAESVKELHAKYGDKVQFSYRHFPLRSMHPNAQRAAEYSQCAQAQGRFWDMHDKIYAGGAINEETLKSQAQELGLDTAKLEECLASGRAAAEVEEDFQKGSEMGVEGTPTFFINGRHHLGAPTVEGLTAAIDAALKKQGVAAPAAAKPAAATEAPADAPADAAAGN